VLDGIASLVDKSLLRQEDGPNGDPRFGMLETIREFALEQLAAVGEEQAVRDAQAAWFVELAESARPERYGGVRQSRSLDLLQVEYGNLRAALTWLETRGESERLVQLTGALGWFWHLRAHLSEGRVWLERAVELSKGESSSLTEQARAFRSAGLLAWEQADFARATLLVKEALKISESIDDRAGIGLALLNLGVIEEKQGNDDRAMTYYEQTLEIFREMKNTAGVAHTLVNMGDASFRMNDLASAASFTEEALRLARRISDPMYTALALTNTGQNAMARGESGAEAASHFLESLALAYSTSNSWFVGDALAGMAWVVAAAGHPEQGARWLGAAQAICDAIGTPSVPHHELFARVLAAVRAGLTESAFAAAWEAGRALPVADAVTEAQGWNSPAKPAPQPATTAAKSAPSGGASQLNLTERELDVLRLVVEGKSSREIAEVLFISPRTATTHVANILAKLGVNSRSAAVAVAFQQGIV
jgi:DNA-binding CsgD family transcriptional regulator/tetratricopeptide (TPR) repeat protein